MSVVPNFHARECIHCERVPEAQYFAHVHGRYVQNIGGDAWLTIKHWGGGLQPPKPPPPQLRRLCQGKTTGCDAKVTFLSGTLHIAKITGAWNTQCWTHHHSLHFQYQASIRFTGGSGCAGYI